jgi:cell division protein FtsQ
MKINMKKSTTFLWPISLAILFCLVAFTEYRNAEKPCKGLIIQIEQEENKDGAEDDIYFIEKENVEDIVTYKGREPIEDVKLININVTDVEKRVKMDKFVKNVEVFKTLKGELNVRVIQRRPIARFIRSDSSFYVSNEGIFLPLSSRYSARVILISEEDKSPYFLNNGLSNEADFSLYQLLLAINKDDFFSKVVSEIILKKDGQVVILPQLSKQEIVWGLPTATESKYEKLKKLYHEILPSKGWNRYERINLSFKDQIICE